MEGTCFFCGNSAAVFVKPGGKRITLHQMVSNSWRSSAAMPLPPPLSSLPLAVPSVGRFCATSRQRRLVDIFLKMYGFLVKACCDTTNTHETGHIQIPTHPSFFFFSCKNLGSRLLCPQIDSRSEARSRCFCALTPPPTHTHYCLLCCCGIMRNV